MFICSYEHGDKEVAFETEEEVEIFLKVMSNQYSSSVHISELLLDGQKFFADIDLSDWEQELSNHELSLIKAAKKKVLQAAIQKKQEELDALKSQL